MIEEDDEKVVGLGVRPRRDDIELQLQPDYKTWECAGGRMGHGPYLVNEALALVQCATCKRLLNPHYVIAQLLRQQGEFMALHERYQDEMRRLKERSRTKCQHCGEMTRITNR